MMHSNPGLWEIFSVVVWLMVSMNYGKHSWTKQVISFVLGAVHGVDL